MERGKSAIGTATGSAWGTGIPSTTTTSYNPSGDPLGTTDADANASPVIPGHVGNGTNGACNGASTCTTYDANYGFLASTSGNAFYKTGSVGYTTTAAGGYGLWPTSTTDANGQTTSTTYDVLGRTLTTTSPGETGAWTTQMAYDVWCPTTGAALACAEADATQRLDASTTITSRIFYDGLGRAVESRTPGPSGQDVVQYVLYDNLGNRSFVSQPYFVTAYTGPMGAGAYSPPDTGKAGTTTTYDSLGRVLTSKDANSATTTTGYASVCAPAGTGDTGCFAATTMVDANGHQSASFTDALGGADYAQSFTGKGPYTLYRTIKAQRDLLGDTMSTTYADGTHQATATYDALKRQTAFTDPDLGSYTLGYDPNGNLLSSVDPRGASGTVYLGYDGLNRNVWRSTNSTGSSPLSTATYDSTAGGNQGLGRLTSEAFASGPSQSVTGSYAYVYDTRGRQTGWSETLGTTNYPFTLGYNDAGQATTLTYPDGDVVTTSYGAQDWLSGVTEAKSGTTNTLLNTVSYTGANGASELPTSASVDNGVYTWNLGYDTDLRVQETKATQVSNNAVLFDQTRGFDAIGNVTSTSTTVVAGTDNQQFCYDEQNRLVWAGSQGTPSCGGTLTPGTLNSGNARYTQTYSYDGLNRLTSGPLGSGYTYGDTNHLDAMTSAPSYTASYDAAGSMTSRNGQALGYDALRELISWQNAATNPTQTASYAYNGEGQRVQQVVNNTGTITTTQYIGTYEDIATTGGTTTTTKYYQVGKVGTAESVNGTLSFQVNDDLGSVSEALTASGGVQATTLYAPFGAVRYSNGTMPTSYGYTKMRQDPSGLNYDNARYYDPSAGQFTAADYVAGPNRYAYVSNNPETTTDPSGNCPWCIGALIGAAVGAAVSYGGQVVHNVQQHGLTASAFTHVDAGAILKAAVAGAIIGAGGALLEGAVAGLQLGAGALLGAKLAIGAATGAAGQMLDNAMNGRSLMNGVGMAALEGAATAGILHGLFHGGGGAAADSGGDTGGGGDGEGGGDGGGCNSFQGNTVVATPSGEQAIDTLAVGSTVLAYDSATGKAQAEPVQHVFINHDTNLLDVTIATSTDATPATTDTTKQHDADVKAHGSQAPPSSTETLHTTTEHPFLTTDRGFVDAASLVPGEQVRQLDGSVGTVVAVRVTPGAAVRYNLTVQDLHTYAVGDGQWVVHNTICRTDPYDRSKLGNTPSQSATRTVVSREPTCHWCGDPSTVADHTPSLKVRWKAGDFDGMSDADARAAADDPNQMVGSCQSCNWSHSGSDVGPGGPGEWDPLTSPSNRAKLRWVL